MAMVEVEDAAYRRTHSPRQLTWFEDWRPHGA